MPEINLVFFLNPGGSEASLKGIPETPQAEWQAACSSLVGNACMQENWKAVDKKIACIFVVLKLSYMAAIGRTNCVHVLIVSNLKSQPNQTLQN